MKVIWTSEKDINQYTCTHIVCNEIKIKSNEYMKNGL